MLSLFLHHACHEGTSPHNTVLLHDPCYILLTTAVIHGCMCTRFTAFLTHDAHAHMHAWTHTYVVQIVQVEPMIFLEISTVQHQFFLGFPQCLFLIFLTL